jgi:transmembrane sensor
MTNPEQNPSGGDAIRQQAAEWLIRRRDDESWKVEDDALLNAWLDKSPAHAIAFWRLEDVWAKADRLGALRRPIREPAADHTRTAIFKATAAVVIGVALAAGAARSLMAERSQSYETPLGGREVLTLRDGSQIELNTSTRLRISDRTDRREIWLDRGEAFFDVKHDAQRPFIVIAGDHQVIDLGTKFVMRRDSERLQVAVVEGDVRLNRQAGQPHAGSAVLSAGDVATATATALSVTKRTTAALNEELGWRRGVLVFRHTTLADAVAEFNRYNQKKLTIADPSVKRLRIGGTFPTANVEGFADAAREILKLHVTRNDDETIISR